MGVNLPADAVIATSLAGYSGQPRAWRLLSADNLANKAGRAGRRGQTSRERGEFYLIVPQADELQLIEDLGSAETEKLTKPAEVLRAFITEPAEPARVRSSYRDIKSVTSLVLQVLCQDNFGRNEKNLLRRIRTVLGGMLLQHEPNPPKFSPEEVLQTLQDRNPIGVRDDHLFGLTGLGAALGTSSLDLDLAPTLERIARLSTHDAGRIDLLWNACRSSAIQRATLWISLPPAQERHLPSLRQSVLDIAWAYCHEKADIRRSSASSLELDGNEIPEPLVEKGDRILSEELCHLLEERDGESASDVEVNALLRALILNEWSLGIPFDQICARFTRAVKSAETLGPREHRVKLRIYPTDVEQLGDQVAGVLRGAAGLAIGDNGVVYTDKIQAMATEVELGVPSWLAPLLRLRLSSLHRERFGFLWNAEAPESLLDVLNRPELASAKGVNVDQIAEAKRVIAIRESDRESSRIVLADRWARVYVPGGEGDQFGELADVLNEYESAENYAESLRDVLQTFGLRVEISSSDFWVTVQCASRNSKIGIYVPKDRITGKMVEAASNLDGLFLGRTGLTSSGEQRLGKPHRVVFAAPEQFLTVLANLVDLHGEGVAGGQVVNALRDMDNSAFGSDSWSVRDRKLALPPPFDGDMSRPDAEIQTVPADESTAE
ncbi:MAG: hypothetical protein LBG60_14475 [Bifidobacteriaceae bacterium]|jgi:ATP-dependent RNA helicase HelY|nr:hypothetical protein [Bifidobacteriaceae bacterium]